jgi:hypothetical protein
MRRGEQPTNHPTHDHDDAEVQDRGTPIKRRTFIKRSAQAAAGAATMGVVSGATPALGQPGDGVRGDPARGFTHNLRVVSYSDVGGRGGAFKLAMDVRDGRWLLYMGHLWHRGWSILDVTDPRRPELVNFIEGPENTWTIQMDVNDGKMVTSLERMPPSWGGDPTQPFDEGVLIWDIASDPTNPSLLGQYQTGGSGTHRNGYPGGRYVHLAAGMPGYQGNIYVIIDIDDPANPVEVSRWWVEGQHTAGGEQLGEAGVSLHGPPYVVGNLVYLPYGGAGMIILDISNISQPQFVGRIDFSPPFNSNIGCHSILPLPNRDLAVACSEAIREDCNEPLNHVSLVDTSDPASPVLLAVFPVPVPPKGAGYADFCDRGGGRFGPHNFNQLHYSPHTDHSDRLIYVTYFSGGLRVFNIENPRVPREVAYFVPPDPTERFGPIPSGTIVQSEDVLVDRRGYIYVSNKQQGIWILRHTGAA